jgi:hypothetical protein
VEEDVRVVNAVVPLLAAVLGGLVVYWLSGRRAQKEWRYKKRAEVLSDVYRLLSQLQTTAGLATRPGLTLEVRKARIFENRRALEELTFYLHAHKLWVDARTLPIINEFVVGLSSALKHYEAEINKGTPDSPLAARAAEHVQRIVPEAEQVLEAEFRAIVYPPPWWVYPLRGLEWFEARNRRAAEPPAGSSAHENHP